MPSASPIPADATHATSTIRSRRGQRVGEKFRGASPMGVAAKDRDVAVGTARMTSSSAPQRRLGRWKGARCRVVAYQPNHPRYDRTWYVVLAGPLRREYELMLSPSDPSRVFGSLVEKDGCTTWYHGSFQSQGLRAWVSRYLEVTVK